MSLPVSRRTLGLCLLSLLVGLVPFVSQSAPSLRNVSVTSTFENTTTVLSADVRNGGGGDMLLRINWGDGTGWEAYTAASTVTNFALGHAYVDDSPTNTPADLYTISMTLSNNTGEFETNIGVAVQNVAPQLSLTVNSPINVGAPATLRGFNIREFPVSAGSSPYGMAIGPDGNIWVTLYGIDRLARITTNGVITQFPLSGGARRPAGIAAGPDNRLWFCASGSAQIGAMTTNGVVTMYPIPRAANEPGKTPQFITRRGAAMWYTDLSYRIGRITTAGAVTQFVYPAGVNPKGIAVGADNNIWFSAEYTDTMNRLRPSDGATNMYQLDPFVTPELLTLGPDGAIWFTQLGAGDSVPGRIGRVTTNGVVTNFVVGTTGPFGICVGPDNAIWFTESRRGSNSIGRLTLDGQLSRYGLADGSQVSEIITGGDGGLWFTMPSRDRIGRIRFTNPGNVVLHGELNDPGNFDPHTVQINWGDGSAVETLNLAEGIASFHVAHTYSGSQPHYIINVTAVDDDTGNSQAVAVVLVNSIQLTSITCSPATDVRIKGVGANGQTITIESSTDLQNWSSVGTVTSVSNAFEFVHPNPAGVRRFYRGRVP